MLLFDVILVAIEKFLNRVSSQQEKTFLLGFLALRVLVHVCVSQGRSWFYQRQDKKIISKGQRLWRKLPTCKVHTWDERCGERLRDESLPVYITKPLVVLDFVGSAQT